jgi:TPR repeat protein
MATFIFLQSHFKQANEIAFTVDEISAGNRTGSERTREIGFGYHTEKKQYHKALAWYLLAARENNSIAMANIGVLYTHGYGVPKNYFCALQWQLKSIELIDNDITTKNIGTFFEYGNGVPRDKLKALEWYHHSTNKRCIDRMIDQGYYLSESDKSRFDSIMDSLC